jgi:hypothetical protein
MSDNIRKIESKEEMVELLKSRKSYRLYLRSFCYTRYTITPKGNKFTVMSHFSETSETNTIEEVFEPSMYNFLKGVELGALYVEV